MKTFKITLHQNGVIKDTVTGIPVPGEYCGYRFFTHEDPETFGGICISEWRLGAVVRRHNTRKECIQAMKDLINELGENKFKEVIEDHYKRYPLLNDLPVKKHQPK